MSKVENDNTPNIIKHYLGNHLGPYAYDCSGSNFAPSDLDGLPESARKAIEELTSPEVKELIGLGECDGATIQRVVDLVNGLEPDCDGLSRLFAGVDELLNQN